MRLLASLHPLRLDPQFLHFLKARRAKAAVGVYDITRGGGAWWRAPFFALLSAYVAQSLLYFPIAYWTSVAPWPNWMVEDIALKSLFIFFFFLGLYRVLMKPMRPRGGYGG